MINLLAIDLQQAFAQAETWIAALFAWLGSSGVAALIIGLLSKKMTQKVNTQTTVSKAQIEQAASVSAEKAIKAMVGKSFNVNIKAEVDKAVKAQMQPIREQAEYAAVASRNAEIAAAHVLLAQSRSRLLNEQEQENLQSIAKKILAHANGDVVSPTVIEIAAESVATSVEKIDVADNSTVENATLVSFDEVQ